MRITKFAATLLLSSTILVSGCATLDKTSVQASNELPVGSQVEEVSIPYDPSFPKYAVAVEPFGWNMTEDVVEASSDGSKRCIRGHCEAKVAERTIGTGVSAQLTTALTNAGNLAVLDIAQVKKGRDGTYTAKLHKGEKGPFVIRGQVTEFGENVEGSDEHTGVHLGWLGVVAGVAGAVSGERALGWAGAGVAAANPSFDAEEHSRTGMIAFDLQVVNGKTGRIIKAFKVVGTFTAKSAANGVSLFGIGHAKREFAQSVLGQAMRVAMNDAVKKTFDSLKGA